MVIEILQQNGIQLINDIRANMGSAGQNATFETSNSLRIEVTQSGNNFKLQLFGRAFFMTVETGRRPTPNKKPSRAMIERITSWVEARGIDVSAVWAIATKIQQRGTRLWFEGGRTDIVQTAIEDFVNNTSKDLMDAVADQFINEWKSLKTRQGIR